MPVVAVAAGTGWVYVLRGLRVLSSGPRLQGALPLEQLAGASAQPFVRMLVAWLPAGLVAGLVLAALTRLSRPLRAAAIAIPSAVLLLAASAASDAIAQNESFSQHVGPAFSRGGVWLAVALLAAGSLIAPPSADRPDVAADASVS
jgi:hypothetical protein